MKISRIPLILCTILRSSIRRPFHLHSNFVFLLAGFIAFSSSAIGVSFVLLVFLNCGKRTA